MKSYRAHRKNCFSKYAQYAPAPTSPTQPVPPININGLPRFRSALFSVKPAIISDLNELANIINAQLVKLSKGNVSFNNVYTTPNMGSSQFANDLKQLMDLAKTLYYFISVSRNPYTIQELRDFSNNTINDIKRRSFVYTDTSNKMVQTLMKMLTELGTG